MALSLKLLHKRWDVLETIVDLGHDTSLSLFPCSGFDAASRRGLYVAGGTHSNQPQLCACRFFLSQEWSTRNWKGNI
jgi:hypothetical protein